MNHSMILPYKSLQQGWKKIMIFSKKIWINWIFSIKPDIFD